MATALKDDRLARALELLDHHIDPEIEAGYQTLEERILAQALENVERAERRLREIEALVGEDVMAGSR
jgi:DNA-binding ferritin-like protein (Dps family)